MVCGFQCYIGQLKNYMAEISPTTMDDCQCSISHLRNLDYINFFMGKGKAFALVSGVLMTRNFHLPILKENINIMENIIPFCSSIIKSKKAYHCL